MGGGTSRFEETDWTKATGKLTTHEETIDGADPTQEYGVYYITKKGMMNQRDFEVTDKDSNLIYSTKYIEGTLAWFDVLGPGVPGEEDYKLRVQVDLSRRYWVIYRFGIPSYQGQFADMTATNALRQARGELQPCLYKKACITVSWSRYHALVHLYGPPPENHKQNQDSEEVPSWATPAMMETSNTKTSTTTMLTMMTSAKESMSSLLSAATNASSVGSDTVTASGGSGTNIAAVAAATTTENENEDDTKNKNQSDSNNEPGAEETKDDNIQAMLKPGKDMLSLIDNHSIDDVPKDRLSVSNNNAEDSSDERANNDDEDDDNDDDIYGLPMRDFSHDSDLDPPDFGKDTMAMMEAKKKKKKSQVAKLKQWVEDTTGANDPPPNPMEGYLQLGKPLLKCEEINSFLGQHQTMLVGRREALELELEELEAAAEMGTDAHNPNANVKATTLPTPISPTPTSQAGKEGTTEEDEVMSNTEAVETTNTNTTPTKDGSKSFPRLRKFAKFVTKVTAVIPNTISSATTAVTTSYDSLHTQSDHGNARGVTTAATTNCPEDEEEQSQHYQNRSRTTSDMSNVTDVSAGLLPDGITPATPNNSTRRSSQTKTTTKTGRRLEPLVGFWNWDNTMRVHKMKLHVAAGSDLALHVVLAIVTNQLRYERNVVVSTV